MTHYCLFCNQSAVPVHVHGHYQCAVCHTNILPCCDSDNCDTNLLLANGEDNKKIIQEVDIAIHLKYAGLKKPQ